MSAVSRYFPLAVLLAVLPTSAFPAAPADCSCKHLESLQQEVENARYEAKFFADMAEKFKAIRAHFEEANKDPTNPDAGVNWANRLGLEHERMMAQDFHLPNPRVKGYSGPDSVTMPFGTCEQNDKDLTKLAEGSSCREIGEATSAHEAAHRALCARIGAKAYWERTWDEIAAEEAARYADQAKAMENLLKKVIDNGTLTVEAVLTPVYSAPGFKAGYSHTISRMELKGHSTDAPEWALNGQGRQVSKIEFLKLVGMNCTPSGELIDDVTMTAKTDGFTLSLEGQNKYVSGQVKVKCKGGGGMSGFQPGEMGGGPYFAGEHLASEMSFVRDVATMEFAQVVKSGGINVSGEERVTVKLECPGN